MSVGRLVFSGPWQREPKLQVHTVSISGLHRDSIRVYEV